jgi:2-methylisocitrate lyase-like PEP mutase family enzyme
MTATKDAHARGETFRDLHAGPGIFVIPNPWDAGSARILHGLGFRALATTSAGFAHSRGRRDGAVTRDEALAHAAEIVAATPLPVSGDFENGFGDAPEFVAETIRLAAKAGLSGCSIEDFTGDPANPIYDRVLAVERISAAAEAARALPNPFVLTARCENFLRGRPDLDDTLARIEAYAVAGGDCLYAPALPDPDALREMIAAAGGKPVNALPVGGLADLDVEAFGAAGVRRISLGSGLSRTAYGALIAAGESILDSGNFDALKGGVPMARIESFLE